MKNLRMILDDSGIEFSINENPTKKELEVIEKKIARTKRFKEHAITLSKRIKDEGIEPDEVFMVGTTEVKRYNF